MNKYESFLSVIDNPFNFIQRINIIIHHFEHEK